MRFTTGYGQWRPARRSVERAIGKVQGVEGVVVNFLTGRTVVSCMPSGTSTSTTSELLQEHSTADGAGEVDVQALVQSVQAIGYTAIGKSENRKIGKSGNPKIGKIGRIGNSDW